MQICTRIIELNPCIHIEHIESENLSFFSRYTRELLNQHPIQILAPVSIITTIQLHLKSNF